MGQGGPGTKALPNSTGSGNSGKYNLYLPISFSLLFFCFVYKIFFRCFVSCSFVCCIILHLILLLFIL